MRSMAKAVQAWVQKAWKWRAAPVRGADTAEGPAPELLSLGSDGSGGTYVLNLGTGAIDCVAAAPLVCEPESAPVHPLSQVSMALLAAICEQGGYDTHVDEVGGVTVITGVGGVLLTTLGRRSDMVMLSRLYQVADTTPVRDRVKLLRRLNRRSAMVRFEADNEWLVAQYPFLIRTGLSPAQLLSTLHVFAVETHLHMSACKAHRLLA